MTDKLYTDVVVHYPFSESAGAAINTVDDKSLNNLTLTAATGSPTISTDQTRDYTASLDLVSAAVQLPNTSLMNFGSGEFTIEMFFYWPAANAGALVSRRAVGGATGWSPLEILSDGSLRTRGRYGGSYSDTWITTAAGVVSTGQWHHIAFERKGDVYTLYLDGASVGSFTRAGAIDDTGGAVSIGRSNGGTELRFTGHIQDFRVTKGKARYGAAFTPPAGALSFLGPADPYFDDVTLLLDMAGADAATSVDDLSKSETAVSLVGTAQVDNAQSKFGGTSMLLDGDSDYLTVPNSTALFDASGDWTIEGWFRPLDFSANQTVFSTRDESDSNKGFWCAIQTNGGISMTGINTTTGSAFDTDTATTLFTSGTWAHVALAKSGSSIKLFVDGAEALSASVSGTLAQGDSVLSIGRMDRTAGQNFFDGHVDDIRITKGVARYVAEFTAPDRSFSDLEYDQFAYANTLLLPFEGTDGSTSTTDESPVGATVSFFADAQIDVDQARFGSSSLLLDGSGDYLQAPNSSQEVIDLSSPWTVEAWVRLGSLAATQDIFSTRQTVGGSASNVGGFCVAITTAGELLLFGWSSSQVYSQKISSGAGVGQNAWHHIAASFDGATIRGFVDGERVINASQGAATWGNTSGAASIGVLASSRHLTGHIDDLRVTKGVARYTSSFVAPLRPMLEEPATAPTIDTQPQDTTVNENATATFTVSATASAGSLSYQWQENTGSGFADMSGETSATLDFTAAEADDGNTYRCVVTDANGSVESNAATLTVNAIAPTIDTQPQNATVDENTVAEFTVAATASSGGGSLSYQWQEDSGSGFGDISGETSATLDFTAVEGDDGNSYRCVVTDSNGSTTSDAATLTVTALTPTIDTQPQNQTVGENNDATFTVAATASAGSLSYQWYDASDDSAITGETQASLSLTATLADDGNTYYVIVTDSNGSIQSNTATLTVTDLAPTIDTQPQNDSVTLPGDASFTVVATASAGSLSYQWYDASDDSVIPGATGATYSFTPVAEDDGNTYYVIVTDPNGTVQSNTVTLSVSVPAFSFALDLPASLNVKRHSQQRIDVRADGAITYRWFLDGVQIPGEDKPRLYLYTVPEDAGKELYAEADDDFGQTATSTTATLVALSGELIDNTDQPAAGESDNLPVIIRRSTDWAATVAALEGETVIVEDYIFSGRTFTRRDKLRNPKSD